MLKKVFGEAFKFEEADDQPDLKDKQQPSLSEKDVAEKLHVTGTEMNHHGTITTTSETTSSVATIQLSSTEEGKSDMRRHYASTYYSFLCLTCSQEFIPLDFEEDDEEEEDYYS